MKLNELMRHLRTTKKTAGKLDVDVEFYVGETQYIIDEIGQFGVIPDVVISLKRKYRNKKLK
jgi:hypothetical protein